MAAAILSPDDIISPTKLFTTLEFSHKSLNVVTAPSTLFVVLPILAPTFKVFCSFILLENEKSLNLNLLPFSTGINLY